MASRARSHCWMPALERRHKVFSGGNSQRAQLNYFSSWSCVPEGLPHVDKRGQPQPVGLKLSHAFCRACTGDQRRSRNVIIQAHDELNFLYHLCLGQRMCPVLLDRKLCAGPELHFCCVLSHFTFHLHCQAGFRLLHARVFRQGRVYHPCFHIGWLGSEELSQSALECLTSARLLLQQIIWVLPHSATGRSYLQA